MLLNVVLLNRYGRIWPLVGSFLLCSSFCVLAIPAGYFRPGLTAAFSIVANFFIFTAEGIVYQLGFVGHVLPQRSRLWRLKASSQDAVLGLFS